MKPRKTFGQRLEKVWEDPRALGVKLLQGAIDHLRGYSYDFDRNGERRLLERMGTLGARTVFDVGANVGDWTLAAAQLMPEAHIHSFELSPRTWRTLSQRVSGPRFTVNNCGMGDRDGSIAFKDYGENSTVNTILSNATYHDAQQTAVVSEAQIVTGDRYCEQHGIASIDLLKIDVEGADHLVLAGFERMLGARAVRVVQFEYGYTHGDAKFLMRDFHELFARHGYAVGRLERRGVAFGPWHYKMNDFRSGPNYVAVRNDDTAALQALTRFDQRSKQC
ncbi:FkbM family methyltransferase [Hydrogenophaga crocea]|uniref:FkbM family methyltransferase n=1 Tax=Hydrogenophaga crocea TaxID=2716225 RepID=A0A6G8IKM1_9BURK|nr:FkbM family methyltransferase [Hydrogenophaga crocea]QIM53633.1 FkbM family methyltransferase [Hydrogenophaga crocea]